ncbi:hypothetical protein [Deinococcus cellulosilyticus]|uniref:Uncharacterized protein n=1 Tax=Deinococcus cellulosilyticus (strain DSM 18568 / NBRC 106333 / KACC 11606 / 5516J-15) TaxID=1223518 RepID=A0A511NB55_DEIC1|nr:hypothetical protein [Deinococcus cellulosilyticus]GEM50045.1 hypothetical protein DC3_56800 [Deinococcus cellulosilyticus NBRC 106333 = KACC 11606]
MVKVRVHGTPAQVERYMEAMRLMHEAVMQLHAGIPLEEVINVLADIKHPYLIVSESGDYKDQQSGRNPRFSSQVRRYLEVEEGPKV